MLLHSHNIRTYILLTILIPTVCLPAASSSSAAPEEQQSNALTYGPRSLQTMCLEAAKHNLLYNPSHEEVASSFDILRHYGNTNNALKPLILSVLNEALINRAGWQDRGFSHANRPSNDPCYDAALLSYYLQLCSLRYEHIITNKTGTYIGNAKTFRRHYPCVSMEIQSLKSGSGKPKILLSGASPCFSPDGNRLAYIRNKFIHITPVDSFDSDYEKHTLKINTGANFNDNLENAALFWSPNGDRIMCVDQYFDPKLFIICNTISGLRCQTLRLRDAQVFFSPQNDDLIIKKGESYTFNRNYCNILNTLKALDQLSPESDAYTMLIQRYPNCANKNFLSLLLTALQSGWRREKPYVIKSQNETQCLAALCTVSHSMNNKNLFKQANATRTMLKSASSLFSK